MRDPVLVTGAGGFVAGWIIRALLAEGRAVRATVRNLNSTAAIRANLDLSDAENGRLEFVAADLTDSAGWGPAMQGVSEVLHVASPMGGDNLSDRDLIAAAREGTLRVLEAAAAAGARRVVYTSSTAACTPQGAEDRVLDETD